MMIIYGKAGCPHTKRALDAYPDATFVDVLLSPADMEKMLTLTHGIRRVPVIVDADGTVTVGYQRGS